MLGRYKHGKKSTKMMGKKSTKKGKGRKKTTRRKRM